MRTIIALLALAAISLGTAAQEADTSTYVLKLSEDRKDSIAVITDSDFVEKTCYERYTDLDNDGSIDLIRVKELTGQDWYEEFRYTSTQDDGVYDELIYYHEVTANGGEELVQSVLHYYQGFRKISAWMAIHLKGVERPLPMRYRTRRCMEAYSKDVEPQKTSK